MPRRPAFGDCARDRCGPGTRHSAMPGARSEAAAGLGLCGGGRPARAETRSPSALAAGETPSPSMVAAAGRQAQWRPRRGRRLPGHRRCWLCSSWCDWPIGRSSCPRRDWRNRPPCWPTRRSSIIATLGTAPSGQEHWQGFAVDRGYLQYAAASKDRHRMWENLSSGRPPAVCFWYRTGGDQIALPALLGEPLPARVFPTEPGMVTVRLDGRGRLLEYMAHRRIATGLSDAPSQPVDWSALFAIGRSVDRAASSRFGPSAHRPCMPTRWRRGKARIPEDPAMPIRVEGASLGGRVVFFEVVPPWDQDWTDAEEGPSRLPRRMPAGAVWCSTCWRSSAAASSHGTTCASAAAINGRRPSCSSSSCFWDSWTGCWASGTWPFSREEIALFYCVDGAGNADGRHRLGLLLRRGTLRAPVLAADHDHLEPPAGRQVPRPAGGPRYPHRRHVRHTAGAR